MVRRILAGGVLAAMTFLFVYGNASFVSQAVPDSTFIGWASAQGVRVLSMPGEKLRHAVVSEEAIWNQSYNTQVRYWIGGGLGCFFLLGCVCGAVFHVVFRDRRPLDALAGDDAGQRVSRPAIASLALALMGGVALGQALGYAAFLLGWVALRETERHPEMRGRTAAWAGMVIGAVVLLVWTYTLQIQPPLHAFD